MVADMERVRKACEARGWQLASLAGEDPMGGAERFMIIVPHDPTESTAFVFSVTTSWRAVMSCRLSEVRPILEMLEECGVT